MAVDLAIIIVTWNVRDLVLDALNSLIDDLVATSMTYEIYVCDSASADGTVEAIRSNLPQVNVIASQQNLGFAASNNLVLRQIGYGSKDLSLLPKAVYLLNPDTITHKGATQGLYKTLFSDPKIGLVGAALSYADGSFQHSAFSYPGLRQLWVEFFPTPGRLFDSSFNGRYAKELYRSQTPFAVDFVLGATMMLKSEVIVQTGMFDERFFMYCEEVDWAWRIHHAGWNVLCVPSAHVTHIGGQSSSQIRPQSLINLWKSRLLLFEKHYPWQRNVFARTMIQAGIRSKLRQLPHMTTLSTEDRASLAGAYSKILEMASR